jgi:adenylate cyclase
MQDIARWLANDAPHDSVKALFAAFCLEMVRSGVPVWRSSLGLEVLHPEVSGWHHVWTDESLSVEAGDRATAPTSQSYLESPTRIVDETERPFQRRLDAPCHDMPVLEDMRLAGATEYIMYPLPFLDRTRTAVISFATRQPQGFDPASLEQLDYAVRLLSPYLERYVLRRIAIDLLDTYVGPHTGQRILEGRVDRGAVERIEAAIWFADLRGFTLLAEQFPTPEVLAHLNTWFGTIGEVLEVHGGEILKFMGDAVLAIFPTSVGQNRAASCRRALAAAEEFRRRTEADNAVRQSSGAPPMLHGLALHVGEVAYGNVGARQRLDFTVIGPAVNRASRLLDLAKRLDRQVLVSDAVAREVDQPLVDLGSHNLRDVDRPQRVFTLPEWPRHPTNAYGSTTGRRPKAAEPRRDPSASGRRSK